MKKGLDGDSLEPTDPDLLQLYNASPQQHGETDREILANRL